MEPVITTNARKAPEIFTTENLKKKILDQNTFKSSKMR